MAFSFTRETPVLNFGPRHHARRKSRQFLLWPAWAYRVVAPRVRVRQLNVLQRAIMGLCRAGVHRVEAITDHLSIHTDLTAFILSELSGAGYLDPHGLPTDAGVTALEHDALETQEMVAGYVFQDPWKGDLWPRFVESLDYCEVEFKVNGFPSILMGTSGKPRRYDAFTVLPRGDFAPTTPTAAAIVRAIAQHRKGLRFKDADDTDDETLGSFVASGVQISRVSFVENEPRPVYLMTYLYVPKSDAGAVDWYACDPFGLGQSVQLRRRVEAVMRDDPGLFNRINSLVGQTLHDGYADLQRWLETIRLQAGLEIDRRLTVDFRDHPVFKHTLEMESARQEMRKLGEGCPERKVNETLRSGVKVLEALFSSLTISHPFGDVWKRVYVSRVSSRAQEPRLVQQRDRSLCSAIYAGAFRSLGFAEPIPEALLRVTPGQIRSVAEHDAHWKLRPLVTATALVAQRELSHPFARAAKQSPGLLDTINEVAVSGGGAGHAHGDSVSPEDAVVHVDKVYDIVSLLLGLDTPGSDFSTHSTGTAHG